MIVYRSATRREAPEEMTEALVDAAAAVARAADAPGPEAPGREAPEPDATGPTATGPTATARRDPVDWWTERLIEAGELEAAVLDALHADEDAATPAAAPLRRLTRAAARGLAVAHAAERAPARGVDAGPSLARAHAALAAAAHVAAVAVRDAAAALPGDVSVGVPEGYAYYGLYPETYAAAAREFATRVGPPRALVVGIRGIGTGLAAVVADTLGRRGVDVQSVSVRPRGHPFDRTLALDAALDALLREYATRPGAWVAVVDEGPGLSGSSLAGTAAALAARGFDDARIVLFPSWDTDGTGLVSDAARARWPRHRRFVASFDDVVMGRGGPRWPEHGDGPLENVGGGAWRDRHWAADHPDRPAIHPHHESRKYRHAAPDGEDAPVWHTFAGLGRYGRARMAMAERLAAAGFGPRVLGLRRGFLATAEHAGRPLGRQDASPEVLDAMARYLAWRRRELPGTRTVSLDALREMVGHNVRLALGDALADRALGVARVTPAIEAAPVVAIDGRMQPHEWVRGPAGLVKTDGHAHGDDHFLPGAQDVAWDVAGACVEWELAPEARARFVDAYAGAADDAGIRDRLPFHEVAYLAFRLGYATLGAQGLGDHADAAGLRAAGGRYAERLRALLADPA